MGERRDTLTDKPLSDKASILTDLQVLLRAHFALEHWGRIVVELASTERGSVVSDIQVEDLYGDEAAVERAFNSAEARQLAPALARAIDALLMMEDLELDALKGGTFLRTEDEELVFLPGLVGAPSRAFEAQRDAVSAWQRQFNDSSRAELGAGWEAEIVTDNEAGNAAVRRGGHVIMRGSHIILGSFSRPHRSWVWGATNPTLPSPGRKASQALLDAMTDRTAWEISTPGFATDEPTALLLAAWVAKNGGLLGVSKIETPEGFVAIGWRTQER